MIDQTSKFIEEQNFDFEDVKSELDEESPVKRKDPIKFGALGLLDKSINTAVEVLKKYQDRVKEHTASLEKRLLAIEGQIKRLTSP